ncbi:MAG: RNA 3'-terminal phosphate cyclase [Acidobacteriota bacterium]|nr:MAG: RNA 3'-terminal phosphate cyclase [Acidobacteriota bacterium]
MIRIGSGGLAVESSASALRSALALSCASGLPFRWEGFRRKGSTSPGLRPVDAESVRLFAQITGARVDGGGVGEDTVALEPGPVRPGEHRFEVPADEPLMPLLRVALMPLALAGRESSLLLAGSTHAPGGETFEVVGSTFHYFLGKLGIEVSLALEYAGFAPRGGGEVSARLASGSDAAWEPLVLVDREELASIQIISAGASVPAHVRQRQAARARSGVHISGCEPTVQLLKLRARSAGSVVAITGRFGQVPVTFASVSERGKSAESVGEEAARAFRRFTNQPAVVPEILVDSLLLFLAFAQGESRIATPRLPAVAPGVAALIRAFTGREVRIDGKVGQQARIRVAGHKLQTQSESSILKAT